MIYCPTMLTRLFLWCVGFGRHNLRSADICSHLPWESQCNSQQWWMYDALRSIHIKQSSHSSLASPFLQDIGVQTWNQTPRNLHLPLCRTVPQVALDPPMPTFFHVTLKNAHTQDMLCLHPADKSNGQGVQNSSFASQE